MYMHTLLTLWHKYGTRTHIHNKIRVFDARIWRMMAGRVSLHSNYDVVSYDTLCDVFVCTICTEWNVIVIYSYVL